MMLWWAAMLEVSAIGPGRPAAIELRSIAPAADLVPCIAQALAKAGTVATRPIDGGTAIDLRGKRANAGPGDAAGFSIAIAEAGAQRIIRATYRNPVTAKLAQRLMARAAGKCFAQEWRTHEWERH